VAAATEQPGLNKTNETNQNKQPFFMGGAASPTYPSAQAVSMSAPMLSLPLRTRSALACERRESDEHHSRASGRGVVERAALHQGLVVSRVGGQSRVSERS
jgi:hypothetical protein